MQQVTEDESRGQSSVERILLHVVQAVTVAGIIGGYVAMSDLKTSTAVLQSELRSLSERLDDFRALSGDRYTATQAARDIKPLFERIADFEIRLRNLEKTN